MTPRKAKEIEEKLISSIPSLSDEDLIKRWDKEHLKKVTDSDYVYNQRIEAILTLELYDRGYDIVYTWEKVKNKKKKKNSKK